MSKDTSISFPVNRELSNAALARIQEIGVTRASVLRLFFMQMVMEQKLPYGIQAPSAEDIASYSEDATAISVMVDAELKRACDNTLFKLGLNYPMAVTAFYERLLSAKRLPFGVIELIDTSTNICREVVPIDGQLMADFNALLLEKNATIQDMFTRFMQRVVDSKGKMSGAVFPQSAKTQEYAEPGAVQQVSIPVTITVSVPTGSVPLISNESNQ